MSLTAVPSISRHWLAQRLRQAHDLPADPGVLRYVHARDFAATQAAVLVPTKEITTVSKWDDLDYQPDGPPRVFP